MLVVVVGATGTGKSGLSLDLAGRLAERGQPVEIVNADAMQLYRGMDVGTAKLPVDGRRGIRHHMLDVLDPLEEASVAAYQTDARRVIDDIESRGAWPLLVGGSGLYVSSVIYDFEFPGTDAAVRERLEAELVSTGPGMMHRRLLAVDPVAAAAIGPSNGRRIVRALEVVEITGKPFGSGLPAADALWRETAMFGLRAPRDELVARLDERVGQMWSDGLVAEVEGLLPHGLGTTAGRAIGYAQAAAQLRGEMTEAEAIEQTALFTRKYARRQVSWFRRYDAIDWLDYDDPQRARLALAKLDR
ncbi:tRNA (adenosine(37)-N6)-dimethylallyltransferase MiaA [Conyzicola sp.]|uniref:tRNA (adenosine(37)-N6)-dimethylallyltransferase MiaA n=1 Tax=Conyzicola sp. TaxID=1969404 RepID=UPI003989A03A